MHPATDMTLAPARAVRVSRGVCRLFRDMGYGTLTEFTLASGRRLDAIGLGPDGSLIAVEIKTSLADFRSDGKWPEYRDWCDAFYFAVPPDFPQEMLPDDCGLIVADDWDAAVLREAPRHSLVGAGRKAVLLRFALAASTRLHRLTDHAVAEARNL